jgi:hypothetical protein
MATITLRNGKTGKISEFQETDFQEAFREARFYHGLLAMNADVNLSLNTGRGFDITYSDGSRLTLAE